MKQTVNEYMFTEAFRAIRPDNFSYEGLQALFDYFEELESDIGEEIELDVIAICCDYSQFDDLSDFNDQYGLDCKTIDDVRDYTAVIEIPNSDEFIIESF